MRIAIFGVAALAAIVGCSSSSDTLSPGPSTDLAGGGSTHSNDTTITNGPKTPPPPPPVVSSFTLSGAVYGRELGPDTAAVLPVPNAQLTIVKVATVDGDTLNPSVTVATTTTDEHGAYRLDNLSPAYYRIDVTAPAGSPYANATSGIGPARESEIKVYISLARK